MEYLSLETSQRLEDAGFKRPQELIVGDVWYLKRFNFKPKSPITTAGIKNIVSPLYRLNLSDEVVYEKTAYLVSAIKETNNGKRAYMYPLHGEFLEGEWVYVMVHYGAPLKQWTFAPGVDDLYKEMEGYVVSYYKPFWMCSKMIDKGGGITFLPVTGMDKKSSVEALAAGYLAKKLDSK